MLKIILIILLVIVLLYLTNKHENFTKINCWSFPCKIHTDKFGNRLDYIGDKLAIINLGNDYNKYATRKCDRYHTRKTSRRRYGSSTKVCADYDPVTIKYYERVFSRNFENDVVIRIKEKNINGILNGKLIWGQHGFTNIGRPDNIPPYNKEMWILYYINNNSDIFMLKNGGDAYEQRLDFSNKTQPFSNSDRRYPRYMTLYEEDQKKRLTITDRNNKNNTDNTLFKKIEIRSPNNKILNDMNFDLVKINSF